MHAAIQAMPGTRRTANAGRSRPRANPIRMLALAVLVTGTATPAPAQTYGWDYPVCLQVYGRINYFDCRYTSIAQCNVSASGRAAQCLLNPYYVPKAHRERPVRRRGTN